MGVLGLLALVAFRMSRSGPDLGTQAAQAYRIRGVPETYIVDRNGTLAGVIIGPSTQSDLVNAIEPLLNK
jgi:cytochrome c biogenesis protein CcmG/thiol:disulfide interchange protein DsbE